RVGFSAEFEKIGFCTRADFRLFGKKLGIREQRVERIITDMTSEQEQVQLMTERSFLREDLKALYLVHYRDKLGRMK
ncbi:MAG: type II toxin-antitoxin system HipA family toxin, partial [Bacteroidota bacterium]